MEYNKLPEGEYCLYLRKSRTDLEAESRGEGETLARHKKNLLSLSKRLNLNITHIYPEVVSGERIKDRPEMMKLLEDVESGKWKGVLVMEVERLARGDTMDQGIVAQTFKYANTLIVTPLKTYDPNDQHDEEYFEFGLFMSRREFKTITRRLQGGRIDSVLEGRYVGNIPPYGYTRKKLDGKGFTLEPHPDQAPIVKMIFDLYTDTDPKRRKGTGLIARYLNDMKIPTARNKEWIVATVNGIIRNPVYIGRVRWNSRPQVRSKNGNSRPRKKREEWTEVEGKHPAIIEVDKFDQANKMMMDNSHPPAPAGKISNPLAGLIRCGKCQKAMIYRPYTKQPAHIMCSNQRCDNKSALFEYVENKVLDSLYSWLENYKMEFAQKKRPEKKKQSLSINVLENSLNALNKEIQDLDTQKGNLYDLLERKIYTEQEFLDRSQNIAERISLTKIQIEKTEKEINKEISKNTAHKEMIPMVESVLHRYSKTNKPETKNELLRSVLEQAIYVKEKNQRLDDFSLTLYPKIPNR